MENSHIEWTDHTFNPWIGCTKVSPGCANCYAEAKDKRFHDGIHWGPNATRHRTSVNYWKDPIRWNKKAIGIQYAVCPKCHWRGLYQDVCPTPECLTLGGEMDRSSPRVFCASMADWLDEKVPIEWLCNLLELIHACPNLDWLLLTKRPENWAKRLAEVLVFADQNDEPDNQRHRDFYHWLNLWLNAHQAPDNIWIGTSVEDQKRANERIPAITLIPAKIRFLSCEPLLSAIEFSDVTQRADCTKVLGQKALSGIHWVICGGESGPNARPINPDWARSLRDQCAALTVAFFFKQWGEYMPEDDEATPVVMARVGKKNAGRELDGEIYNAFPTLK